jgi:hypothetical protein
MFRRIETQKQEERKMEIKKLNKLTMRAMAPSGVVKDLIANLENGDAAQLATIVGVVASYSEVQNSYGTSIRLDGQFMAERTEDGTRFVARKMFLPDKSDQIVAALKESETSQVEFRLQVDVVKDAKVGAGYFYDVYDPRTAKAVPLLERLLSEATAELKQLAH